jgi:hypothetical protein
MIELIKLERDYAMIAGWWKAHEMPAPPREILPEWGLLVSDGQTAIAATFVYRELTGRICFVEWTISNPLVPRHAVDVAVKEMLSFVLREAPRQGYPIVLTSVGEGSGLRHVCRRLGWKDCTGKPHRHMLTVSTGKN